MQESAIMFSRTLRGIGSIDSEQEALDTLSYKANNPNFFNFIKEEYERDNQIVNLYGMVENMGIIKNASYYMFGGNRDSESFRNSGQALKNVKIYGVNLRDYRMPYRNDDIER